MTDRRVAVVGAGAVGTTTAHDLAVRGADVTLYEAGAVGSGSSGRAAGVCYDAFTDRTDAALGQRSMERFDELSGDGDFVFEACPYVWFARERSEGGEAGRRAQHRAAAIREGVERMRDNGLDVSLVEPAELVEAFPALRVEDVTVAAIARNAGHTDPATYTQLLADRAVEAGVDLHEGTAVTLTEDGTVETGVGVESFDAVVVAAGAHTRQVVSSVAPLAVKPYRVQALTTDPHPMRGALPMCYDATAGCYLRPHHDGGLLVGDGTEPVERDPDDWERAADDWFVEDCAGYLETTVGRALPVERAWAGLCTATPDGHPLLGEVVEGVFVATGWQGHGFMRAPAIGERLAAAVLEAHPLPPHFAPDRFDEDDQSFDIVEGMDVEARLE